MISLTRRERIDAAIRNACAKSAHYGRVVPVDLHQDCFHEFPPEKIYKDGKLHRDSSNARYHQCIKCEELVIKK